jgi:septum formation protein
VIAADTVVVLDGELLGKPADAAETRAMLRRLAGRERTIHTGGVELAASGPDGVRRAAAVATSRDRIAPMYEATIAWYVASGEPLDQAGAYAIQELGALFVETVDGNYTNCRRPAAAGRYGLFREMGEDLLAFRRNPEAPTS